MGAPGLAFETWDPRNRSSMEVPPSPLSSRAKPRDVQFYSTPNKGKTLIPGGFSESVTFILAALKGSGFRIYGNTFPITATSCRPAKPPLMV